MRITLIRIALLMASALGSSQVQAQSACNGQATLGYFCGVASSTGLPALVSPNTLFSQSFGTTSGTILNRTATWGATSQPTLGANGGTGGAITLNGATSGSVTIGAKAAAGTGTVFNLPTTNGASNYVLITDGAGNTSWVSAGSGTVSSVGLSMPGIFSVTNSPVTSTGTLTATLNNQSANLVWAGPTTGSAAPTFRSLVGADLPNPSSSSLGGVQSFAGVASQWIRQISTSGVPTASQPAFTDISGTVAAAQLPTPTATTLGGIQSYAGVTNQWLSSITTSGVPVSTQPAFSNLSGQASLAQLPGIGNNTILSNIAGGSATPLANSLSAIIDASAGNVQGEVLYRGSSSWVVLAPGVSGQVLTTGGSSANPSWTSVTGTGTVTSVATNNGITGGTFTTSGTISLATINTGNVLANVSGGSTYPTPTTPSAVLDVIGSTQGSVLYRGASVWGALGPGTNGQFLQTAGAGSTPSWASISTGGGITNSPNQIQLVAPPTAQGRLTGQANTPVMTTTQANITTLRYDCYVGNGVPYFDGTYDQVDTISSCEVTDAMVSAASAGQVVSGQVYDVWWAHGGANRICLAMSTSAGGGGGWASDTGGSNTARGGGYTQIDRITRSYPTNKNAISYCYNGSTNYGTLSANQATYLGTIYANANGQTSWNIGGSASGGSAGAFYIWNFYNRNVATATTQDNGSLYTNSSSTVRQARGSTGNQVCFVLGLQEDSIHALYNAGSLTTNVVGAYIQTGISLDSTTGYNVVPSYFFAGQTGVEGIGTQSTNGGEFPVGPGIHCVYALENSDGTHSNQFDEFSVNALSVTARN